MARHICSQSSQSQAVSNVDQLATSKGLPVEKETLNNFSKRPGSNNHLLNHL